MGAMNIQDLRQIGYRLFSELGTTRLRPFTSEVIGKGAGGDKTYGIDKRSEDIIIGSLEGLGEPVSIVSEEYGNKEIFGGGPQVIIDPIDGSRNAVNGVPLYCTSIAVCDGENFRDLTLAYIINLLTGDEFWAEKGMGAFFNGESIHGQDDDQFYLIAYEAQIPGIDLPKILKLLAAAGRTRCLGATALDLALVAYGAVSIFVTPSPSRSFDFAAGYLMVKEAGGIITDYKGVSLEGAVAGLKTRTALLAAGNHRLHSSALLLLND